MDSVSKISSADAAGSFQPRIDYIRFPYFRNLVEGARIDFDSPFTVFVGQNGCGKSSALQALYGAPKGYSLTKYWFSTALDPIKEPTASDRHCFIYSYSGNGPSKEVLKRRSFKHGQFDLFDSSPAIAAYGMESPDTRTLEPIEKQVVYLNFRSAQNAFEKVFNEERPPKTGIQDFLRSRSWCLHQAFNNKLGFQDGRFSFTHDPVIDLPPQQIEEASKILGRKYVGARIVRHHLFRIWGHSLMLRTELAEYSEAFAGSGEFAVFLLVHEIMSAPEKSLLLLDEPETSLHPGAQRALQRFLLEQCIKRKQQVIVCTHSPNLIEGLPRDWIKVFRDNGTGKFEVIQAASPLEAFHFIGQSFSKSTIIVEDRLAKLILDAVLIAMGDQTASLFEIRYPPGGQSQIKQDCVIYSNQAPAYQIFIVFDADVKPNQDFVNPRSKMIAEIYDDPDTAISWLDQYLSDMGYHGIKFPQNGGNADPKNRAELRNQMVCYIEFCMNKIRYFPVDLEAMIWNEELANSLMIATGVDPSGFESLTHKERFYRLGSQTNAKPDFDGGDLDVIHGLFVQRWAKTKSPGFQEIARIICDLIPLASSSSP